MLKDFKPRLYQETIFATAMDYNTLVVLPTGLGKTAIALLLAVQRLRKYPDSKILILAPTKPLCEQTLEYFKEKLDFDKNKMVLFTGEVAPEKRAELWKTCQIISSTPQGLENDIISNKINLSEVSLLVIDECHRAVKDFSYVWVSKKYHELAKNPRILALTASPGSDNETINEVIRNLFIEKLEIRNEKDQDVAPYIQDVKVTWVKVNLPLEFLEIQKILKDLTNQRIIDIKNLKAITNITSENSKKELLMMQGHLQKEIMNGGKTLEVLKSLSLMAEIMKISHGLELLETQGISSLKNYLEKIEEEALTTKVKATQNIARDINFRSALVKTKTLFEKKIEHPKLETLFEIVKKEISKDIKTKIIVFSQYRDSVKQITTEIEKLENARPIMFVGQAKKNGSGLSQKQQIEILDKFRNNEYNVLVSSSVGEEGLDIPQVNTVIFYEPVPSAIRTIQRRGRTGRMSEGNVIMLYAQNTRDEAYRWSAFHKEKKMYKNMELLKKEVSLKEFEKPKENLKDFIFEKPKVIVDYREKASQVIKNLIDLGCDIKLETLSTADYVVSNRCAIEYKTKNDFLNSLLDGRLLIQLKEIKQTYSRPIVLIEGEEDIYTIKNVHPNAIRGLLATITVSYGIPILFTKDSKESAALIAIIAKREQEETGKEFSHHASNKPKGLKEQQEYIVSALPGVGAGLSKPLLTYFGSIKKIINADIEELKKVENIGEIKANLIKNVVDKEYEKN